MCMNWKKKRRKKYKIHAYNTQSTSGGSEDEFEKKAATKKIHEEEEDYDETATKSLNTSVKGAHVCVSCLYNVWSWMKTIFDKRGLTYLKKDCNALFRIGLVKQPPIANDIFQNNHNVQTIWKLQLNKHFTSAIAYGEHISWASIAMRGSKREDTSTAVEKVMNKNMRTTHTGSNISILTIIYHDTSMHILF